MPFKCVCVYLKCRTTETNFSINGQSCAYLKLRTRSFIRVSRVDGRGSSTQTLCCFPRCIGWEMNRNRSSQGVDWCPQQLAALQVIAQLCNTTMPSAYWFLDTELSASRKVENNMLLLLFTQFLIFFRSQLSGLKQGLSEIMQVEMLFGVVNMKPILFFY